MKNYNVFKIILYLLFFFSSIIISEQSIQNEFIFKCGADNEEDPTLVNDPKPINEESPEYRNVYENLDENGFKELKIWLDLENFNDEVDQYHIDNDVKQLFIYGLEKAKTTLEALLKVKPVKNYCFTDDQITDKSIAKWDVYKIGNNVCGEDKGMLFFGIDLFVFVRFGDNTQMGENTLASASVKYADFETNQPLLGVILINKDIDYSKLDSKEYFAGIMIHELTHILGFSNFYFSNDFILRKTDIFGIERAYINSPKVLSVAQNYFNCDSLDGVQLEKSEGSGTLSPHWSARILLGEYMNKYIYTAEQVISEFTLAFLEDTGFYKATYYTGGLMQFGKHKGCDFLNLKCINDNNDEVKFTNEFFKKIYSTSLNYDTSCSSGRQSRTYHAIYNYNEEIPEIYRYFTEEPSWGGWKSADYCPISIELHNQEDSDKYYVGHCSQKGSDKYGSKIAYGQTNSELYYTSGQINEITKENNSENSFCVLSSLISNSISNHGYYSNTLRAVCYKMHCSEKSLTIQINNDFIVCPRPGGKIKAVNFDGYLSCPDYNLICSGTVLCNDMFDCVTKQSSLKNNIIYDYDNDIKTTQDLEEIKNADFVEDVYELSTDGKCPQYCAQCNESGQCIKCANNYGIVQLNDEEPIKRECKLITELSQGYYENGGIYYKCMENCAKCPSSDICEECISEYFVNNNECTEGISKCKKHDLNGKCLECKFGYTIVNEGNSCEITNCQTIEDNTCNACNTGFFKSNGICYTNVENCNIYDEESDNCKECSVNYAFEENDRRNCKSKSVFEEYYYTKDNGISYFKCDGNGTGRVQYCKNCVFNNNDNGLECTRCKDDYALKDDDKKHCFLKSTHYNNNDYYFPDEFHFKTCSKTINNCKQCQKIDNTNNIRCTKCQNNYFFVNGNYDVCHKKEDITPINEYYLDAEKNEYFSCCSTDYHLVSNCKECNRKDSCELCKEDYTFINGDQTSCVKIDTLGQQYIQDINDSRFYKRCNNYINNCDICEVSTECLSCGTGYGLFKDRKSCIDINDQKYYQNQDELYDLCIDNLENCVECSDNTHCLSCKEGYHLKNDICHLKIPHCTNYDNDIKCTSCEPGYQVNSNSNICEIGYVRCIEVDNNGDCTKCEDNYRPYNNVCYEKVLNCDEYEEGPNCRRCQVGYAFEESNRSECKDINYFNELYFTKDGICYLLCGGTGTGRIQNCHKCEYDNAGDNLICKECKQNYILKDEETNRCYDEENYRNNNEYYYEDSLHVKNCNYLIQNCKKCEKTEDDKLCRECITNYFIVNENYRDCIQKNDITPIKEFYLYEGEYFYCGNIKYNTIENCKECDSKTSCNLCKEGYTFIDAIKRECKKIDDLGDKYTIDNEDPTIYRKCNYFIENCVTCSSYDSCLSCESQYGLFYDKSKCVDVNDNKYFKKESDSLYYQCNQGVNNCETCSSENKCIKCTEGYVKLNSDSSMCVLKNDLNIEKYYVDPNDDNNLLICSSYIDDCYSCQYPSGCKLCISGYILLNDNFRKCYDKSKISLSNYYTNDEIIYYSCNDKRYNSDKRCISKISKQSIVLTFLQVQIINNKLVCYMTTQSTIPEGFSLKLKINVSSNNVLRHLEEKVISLTFSNEYTGSSVVSFISNEPVITDGEQNKNIQIKDIGFNSEDSTTNSIVGNNYCFLNFDKNSELTDTGRVSSLIQAKKIPDCSSLQTESVVSLSVGNIDGCDFNLNSDMPVSFSNDKLNLELHEYDNNKNKINAECNTAKINIKTISCKINEENIDNNYSFTEGIITQPDKFITINSGDNKFKILCGVEKTDNSKKVIIAVSVCSCVLVCAIVALIIVILKKNKNSESLPTKSLSIQKKSINSTVKLENENSEKAETEDNTLNMNDNKKKKKNKENEKSKSKLKEKKSKEKKSKEKSKEKKSKEKTKKEKDKKKGKKEV